MRLQSGGAGNPVKKGKIYAKQVEKEPGNDDPWLKQSLAAAKQKEEYASRGYPPTQEMISSHKCFHEPFPSLFFVVSLAHFP